MLRDNCHLWFDSQPGRILLINEVKFLNQAITLSYTQKILQLGYLGWENQFIDCGCYRSFFILDKKQWKLQECGYIQSSATELAIASDSIDLLILPHFLEFTPHHHQILQEVDRVLKPEGELIILGFNPWSFFALSQLFQRRPAKRQRNDHFISRFRMLNWLRRLNFEAEVVAGFNSKQIAQDDHAWQQNKKSLTVTAYAIHAIKRQFNIIPWQTDWITNNQFALANANDSITSSNQQNNEK